MDIINLGKIPVEKRFIYQKSLNKYLKLKNNENYEEYEFVVRQIEKDMNLKEIQDFNFKEWKYMIDEKFNFWLMRNDYIERNFIIKKE